MCRYFAYISQTEEALLADVLVRPQHALVKQIDEHFLPDVHIQFQASDEGSPNALSNLDGLGVAWYSRTANEFDVDGENSDAPLPTVFKTVRPPLHDLNFKSLADNTASTCLVAHIRAGTPVVEINNHPFVWGRHVFCHNGVVQDFDTIQLPLLQLLSPAARKAIVGTTDSEHCAALIFTHLDPTGPWTRQYNLDELQAAVRATIVDLQRLIDSDGIKSNGHSALNFMLSDGEQMVATRFAHPPTREPPSLYWSDSAGPTLSRKYEDHPDGLIKLPPTRKPCREHGKHVIIASEPSTFRHHQWNLIPSNNMVSVGTEVELTISPLSSSAH